MAYTMLQRSCGQGWSNQRTTTPEMGSYKFYEHCFKEVKGHQGSCTGHLQGMERLSHAFHGFYLLGQFFLCGISLDSIYSGSSGMDGRLSQI